MTRPRLVPTRTQALPALTAMTVLVTLELIRMSGPLFEPAFAVGVVTVAGTALGTYAAPGLVLALLGAASLLVARRRRSGSRPFDHSRPALALGAALLVALRVAVQALDGSTRVTVGLAAVAAALALLAVCVATTVRARGAASAASAIALGAAGSVGLALALGTWDSVWRHDALGWTVTLVQGVLLLGLTASALTVPQATPRPQATDVTGTGASASPAVRNTMRPPTRALWLLGPALGLGAMALLNPAFAASQTGLPLAACGPVLAVGLLLTAAITRRFYTATPSSTAEQAVVELDAVADAAGPRPGGRITLVRALAPVLAPVGTVGVYWLDGYGALACLVLAQIGLVAALALAWSGPRPATVVRKVASWRALPRWIGAGVAVGVGTVLPILIFQIDYDVPLPFPNRFVPVAVALVVTITAAVLGGGDHIADVEAARRAGRRGTPPVPSAPRNRPLELAPAAAVATALVLLGSALAVSAHVRTADTVRAAADATPLPTFGQATDGTLLSWNLHYGVDLTGAVDLEGIARVIEAHDPDVVALQEVSRGWILGGGSDQATWLAHRLGMDLAFGPAADRQFGNVLLSRTGIQHSQLTELPYGDGPQRRSALHGRTSLGRVTSVHLQHRDENTMTRLLQIKALTDQFGPTPVEPARAEADILAGDFNAQPGWAEMTGLLDGGWTSAIDEVGDAAALTFPSDEPEIRIDWVLGRGLRFTSAVVLTDAHASDHLPILVKTEQLSN